MGLMGRRFLTVLGGGMSPLNRILSTAPAMCLPLSELSGTIAVDATGNGHDGRYEESNVDDNVALWVPRADGPGGGITVPYFDGDDYDVDLYDIDASFATCADWDECSIMYYFKGDAAMWAGAALHYLINIESDTSDFIRLLKVSENTLSFFTRIGGTQVTVTHTMSSTGWTCFLATISKTANEKKWYINNEQVGATGTVPNAWAGNVSEGQLGADTVNGRYCFLGYTAYFTVWNKVLTAGERSLVFF